VVLDVVRVADESSSRNFLLRIIDVGNYQESERKKSENVEGDASPQKALAVKLSRQPRNGESMLTLAPVGVEVSAQEVDIVGEDA